MHNLTGRCGSGGSGTPPRKNGLPSGQLKYRWQRFVTWTRETIDAELADLLTRVRHQISNPLVVVLT
jgi:hypothetical protein